MIKSNGLKQFTKGTSVSRKELLADMVSKVGVLCDLDVKIHNCEDDNAMGLELGRTTETPFGKSIPRLEASMAFLLSDFIDIMFHLEIAVASEGSELADVQNLYKMIQGVAASANANAIRAVIEGDELVSASDGPLTPEQVREKLARPAPKTNES